MKTIFFITSLIIFIPSFADAKTGLPVPRYVSLRSTQINVRVGPGRHYPIEWIYVRSCLPVEIISEYENWRKIRDSEGAEGWVHQSMLSGKRYALVKVSVSDIRSQPRNEGRVTARLEQGVLVQLFSCQGEWCKIEAETITGWAPKSDLWGVYTHESIK